MPDLTASRIKDRFAARAIEQQPLRYAELLEGIHPWPEYFDSPAPFDPPTLPFPSDPHLLLVNRTSQGYTEDLYQEAITRGWDEYIEWQLDHENIPENPELDQLLAGYDVLTLPANQIYIYYTGTSAQATIQLANAALARSVMSRRQLFERTVEFWTDHFNISLRANGQFALKPVDDREVIRQHAFGTFPDLLRASAHSGAMLVYLDNYLNVAGRPQENYARELLELHTMGVDGGYTQQDVEEVAKCFTGWTIHPPTSASYGQFQYIDLLHERGPKTVLGQQIPSSGQAEGEAVLDMLLNHPSTARFLAKKMCRWFLAYDPDPAIVNSVAQTYTNTGGDIKEMLRTILRYHNFVQHVRPKHKRPFTFITSLLRAAGATLSDPTLLSRYLDTIGQAPFSWVTPDGFPDDPDFWGTSLLPRWDSSVAVFFSQMPGVTSDTIGSFASTSGNEGREVNRFLTGGALPPWEEAIIHRFHGEALPAYFSQRSWADRDTLTFAASSPGFQWY